MVFNHIAEEILLKRTTGGFFVRIHERMLPAEISEEFVEESLEELVLEFQNESLGELLEYIFLRNSW